MEEEELLEKIRCVDFDSFARDQKLTEMVENLNSQVKKIAQQNFSHSKEIEKNTSKTDTIIHLFLFWIIFSVLSLILNCFFFIFRY